MIGKTHVVKSLGTGYRADAIREARIVAAEFEQQWQEIEPHGIQPTIPTAPERPKFTPTPPALPADKTLRQAFELFRSDPAKQRTRKTDLHYLNLIELTVGLCGENRTIRSIDREASRELLDVLLWLPANAEKKFPKLSPLAASRMAKEKGLPGSFSPASVNGYMCKFPAVMNFCQNEGWIERNPAKGLQVIDRVRRRDKRRPFSTEQLRLIFDAPIYRGCVDDWAGYSTPGYAPPRRGRFWVPLIALFSGMRMNEICQLHVADIHRLDGVDCFFFTERPSDADNGKRLKTAASERFIPIHPQLVKIGFSSFVEQRRAAGAVRLFSELQSPAPAIAATRSASGSDASLSALGRLVRRPASTHSDIAIGTLYARHASSMRSPSHLEAGHPVMAVKGGETAAAYGRGYRARTLHEAMGRIA